MKKSIKKVKFRIFNYIFSSTEIIIENLITINNLNANVTNCFSFCSPKILYQFFSLLVYLKNNL